MWYYTLTVNAKIVPFWTDADSKAVGKATARYIDKHLIPIMERRMNRELMHQPGRPKYPIRWASEKQRKYVMAKLSREGNLPYRRTMKLARRWRIRAALTLVDGQVYMENPSEIAQWVYGDRIGQHQQPFHKDTGWPLAMAFFEDMFLASRDQLAAAWPDILIEIERG